MLERGVLQHNIAARLDLEEIATAHEIIERGEMAGNVVLRVRS
jgi:NADPH:quinone reductase-like Zn-dependent oxidoreductase